MIQGKGVRQLRRRAAFTLMEILIVVSIIIALAAVGGVFFFATLASTEDDVARMQARELEKACQIYRLKHGDWPPSLETLLLPDEKYANRPYLDTQDALKAPWPGVFYQYDPSGQRNAAKNALGLATKPDIWAVNKDGKEVGNWSDK